MPDQLYVSYWLRGFTGPNMPRHFDKALRWFPFSQIPGTRLCGAPNVVSVKPARSVPGFSYPVQGRAR
jgi:hypothetical protein